MTVHAYITLTEDGRVADDSVIEVRDAGFLVADGPVPLRSERLGRLAPARVIEGLATLGFKPIDYYNQLRVTGGFEIVVEPLS